MTDQENEIWEKIQKEEKRKLQAKAFNIMSKIMLFFVLGLFMISPFLQLIVRMFLPDKYHYIALHTSSVQVRRYQNMILAVNQSACFVAIIFYIYCVYYLITNRKTIKSNLKQYIKRIIPLGLFFLLALDIILVTKIRGANEYDLTGHPYMFESIYSYIAYSIVYFFCGMFVSSEKMKKGLFYLLIFTALPLNFMVLLDKWGCSIKYFIGHGGAVAVFHNSNHYGYYLVMVVLTSYILFVYEKKLALKIASAISAIIGSMALIVADVLGSYIAVLFVLFCFTIYCLIKDKNYCFYALSTLISFILVTVIMSFWYPTVISSIVELQKDLGVIASDPLETDLPYTGNTGRWMLWQGVLTHIGEKPFVGFGVEGLLNRYGVGTPHNELLQYMEFFGIPAMLLYLAAVAVIFITILRHSSKFSKATLVCFCASVGYIIGSMFGVTVYYTTPFIYIFLGLTYAEYFKNGAK